MIRSLKNTRISDLEQSPRVRIWDGSKSVQSHARKMVWNSTDLAVLHHIDLPQPSLVERFASGMDDMTQSILFGQHEHSVK